MTTRIYGPPVDVPLPSGHSLGLTASGLNGGFGGVPYAAALAPTAACTWLFRAKSIDPSGYNGVGATLLSQWDTAGGLGRLICYRNTVDDTQLVLGHSNTGGDVVSCTVYTNAGVWTENVEHEVGFVYDGGGVGNAGRAKLYFDGALPTQNHFGTWPAALSNPSAPTNFGHKRGSAASWVPFQGYLYDIRFYDVALTAAQITAAYGNPTDSTLPAPTGRWIFPETSGNWIANPGGYIATPTATGTGRAPTRVIRGWAAGAGQVIRPLGPILPIGDSFTRGYGYDNGPSGYSGYRVECENRALSVYGRKLDVVGPFTDVVPAQNFFDNQHAGIDGRKLTQMNTDAPGWIATYMPAVVILWGGYNDINGDGISGATCRDRLSTLAQTCNTALPGVRIILCTIPRPNTGVGATVDDYNALIPALATTLQGMGINASVADVRAATSLTDILPADNVHMGRIGYERAGLVIADALAALT